MTAPTGRSASGATLKRRLVSLVYEALLLAAVLLAGALPIVVATQGWQPAIARPALQVWLLLLCGVYFVWQWTRMGQTLPMKTWRLRLIAADGTRISAKRAVTRYLAACAGTSLAGAGFWWALVDRERCFLHDRLAGTRIVDVQSDSLAA